MEDNQYCHILVRTRHSNGDKQISALDLVSLIKINNSWKVTLNAQQPVVKRSKAPQSRGFVVPEILKSDKIPAKTHLPEPTLSLLLSLP